MLVSGLAPQRDGALRWRPELVVSGHPDDGVEPIAQGLQRPFDVGDEVGYVPGDDQPVMVRLGSETSNDLTIFGVAHVHIADP